MSFGAHMYTFYWIHRQQWNYVKKCNADGLSEDSFEFYIYVSYYLWIIW